MEVEVMDCHAFTLRRQCGHWDVFGLHDEQAHLTRHIQGVELRRIVEDCLSIYLRTRPRSIDLHGRRVLLSARKAHDLGLIFHGLATNAAEFGALSMPEGMLTVQWRVVSNGSRRLCVEWVESGVGSPLTCDATLLIGATVENCRRTFTPAGMACTFELALD
jgi:two-component sensor histidine kinase